MVEEVWAISQAPIRDLMVCSNPTGTAMEFVSVFGILCHLLTIISVILQIYFTKITVSLSTVFEGFGIKA